MMYIWAWQAPALQPQAWISSSVAAAALNGNPRPPYSSGISAASKPALVSAAHEFGGIGFLVVELAPVAAGKIGADASHEIPDLGIGLAERQPDRFLGCGRARNHVHRVPT